MASKKSWFHLLRRLFIVTESKSRTERKKDRGRRSWVLFGKLKNKRPLASLSAAAPPPTSDEQKHKSAMDEEENSTRHHHGNEIAATGGDNEFQQLSPINKLPGGIAPKSLDDYDDDHHHIEELEIQQKLAAIKIQSAFRGYLARKALRALKGLVRLQALVRGWAVRRQAMNTLKCLQTIVNIQSEVCAKRCDDIVKGTPRIQENKFHHQYCYTEKDIKVDSNSQKRWDDSLLSKEEANAISLNKRVAAIKRERIKEYCLNHRRSTESEQNRLSVKQRYWLEKWVDAQLNKGQELHNINDDGVFSSNAAPADSKNMEEFSNQRSKLRKLQRKYQDETMFDNSPVYIPRRSFHQRKRSTGEEDGCLGSPTVPTYMAATQSAKAKSRRSLSSPRLRPMPMDACSDINSPYKHKLLSPISSINSEMTCNTQICRNISFPQRSPRLKGVTGPVKSNKRSIKDLRLMSEQHSLIN